MNFKFEASKLAQEAIKSYYQEFAGSLQNTSHSQALLYAQKIEKLRKDFLNYLGLNDFLCSFQPNHYYLEKIIFDFLNSQNNKWNVFTNRRELKLNNSCSYSLEEFLKIKELNDFTFLLIDSRSIESPSINLIIESLNKLKNTEPKLQIYSYLISDNLKELKSNLLKNFSFISYDPSKEQSEFGTIFFAFQKDLKLNPVFLGSGGAIFDHQTKEIKLKPLPQLLEIGTQNLISLIVLARYFERITQITTTIPLDSIKNVN